MKKLTSHKASVLTAELTVPFVEPFLDYHDIEFRQDDLRKVGFNVKAKEFPDHDYGDYWGVFYVGKIPMRKEIQKMIEESL